MRPLSRSVTLFVLIPALVAGGSIDLHAAQTTQSRRSKAKPPQKPAPPPAKPAEPVKDAGRTCPAGSEIWRDLHG
jgi:hypothetical protein